MTPGASTASNSFNGDFAFALWDAARRRLMLARDRMGVRPLFYAWHGGCLYFASEAKALFAVPGISAELDPIALDQIFTFWFPLAPRTPFRGVAELPPAHVLVATPDEVFVRRYWQLEYPDAGDADAHDRRGEGEIAEELRALLLDATRIRLRADVPVGAYLSGGLDSSIIAAAVHRLVPERLRTFSVTFESAEFDESAWQLEMVRALGTEHSAIRCRHRAISAAMFPEVIRHGERPILRTAPAPLFALVRARPRERLQGGADRRGRRRGLRRLRHLQGSQAPPLLGPPAAARSSGRSCFSGSTPTFRPCRVSRRAIAQAFFATGLDATGDPLFSHLPRFRTTAGAKVFFSGALREATTGYDALDDLRASLPADFVRWHPLAQAQYLETAYLLPGYILSAQGDRVAMAHAVEGRFPFLDHRVVEFAAKIPPRLKIRGLREKHILRQAMAPLLPPSIGNRAKQPYRAPDSQSLRRRSRAGLCRRTSLGGRNRPLPATSSRAPWPSSSPRARRSRSPAFATTPPSSASCRRSSCIAHSSPAHRPGDVEPNHAVA